MELWGLKTVAWFDWWSIEHFFSGVSIGATVMIYNSKKNISCPKILKRIDIYVVLLLAYFWETIEHYLESGMLGGGHRNLVLWGRVLGESNYNRSIIGSFRISFCEKIFFFYRSCKNFFCHLVDSAYFYFSAFHVFTRNFILKI